MSETEQTIRITAKQDGFRRCGVAHPATVTEHPAARFPEDDLARLEAEPMLIVERVVPTSVPPAPKLSAAAAKLVEEWALDTATIAATGADGSITKADVEAHLRALGDADPDMREGDPKNS